MPLVNNRHKKNLQETEQETAQPFLATWNDEAIFILNDLEKKGIDIYAEGRYGGMENAKVLETEAKLRGEKTASPKNLLNLIKKK